MNDELKVKGIQVRLSPPIEESFFYIYVKKIHEEEWIDYGLWGSTGLPSILNKLYRHGI